MAQWLTHCPSALNAQQIEEGTQSTPVFPNPSEGIINFRRSESSKARLCIYDAMGRSIKDMLLSEKENEINLDQGSGIYYYRIEDHGKVESGKFTIR